MLVSIEDFAGKCRECKYPRFSSDFATGRKVCKICRGRYYIKYRTLNTDRLKIAEKVYYNKNKAEFIWRGICSRANNNNGKFPSYKNVSLAMTHREFVCWYRGHYFSGCSVDRINNAGDYSIANLQMLTKSENSAKHGYNYLAPDGYVWCSGKCKGYSHSRNFDKNSSAKSGYSFVCKSCKAADKAARRAKVKSHGYV